MMLAEEHDILTAEIVITEKGKPVLGAQYSDRIDFNITHDGPFVAVATSMRGQIGIDLSATMNFRDWDAFADDFLDPKEIDQLREIPVLEAPIAAARFWTAKEAILKAAGCGLGIDPREIVLEIGPNLIIRKLPDSLPPQELFVISESEQISGCGLTISVLSHRQTVLPTISKQGVNVADLSCVQQVLFAAKFEYSEIDVKSKI